MSQTLGSWQPEAHVRPLLDLQPLRVLYFVHPMRGRSRSWLVYAEDDQLYVLKFNRHLCNRNLLANETIGACLMHGLGITVPSCRRLVVGPFLLKDACLKETLSHFALVEGTHFGSAYVGSGKKTICDYVAFSDARYNDEMALGVMLFDLWCNNLDTRQVIFLRHRRPVEEDMFFIDNSDICGGADWSFNTSRLGRPFIHSQYLPPRDPQSIDVWCRRFNTLIPPLLEGVIDTMPPHWYTGNIKTLSRILLHRLENLHELVESASWNTSVVASTLVHQEGLSSCRASFAT